MLPWFKKESNLTSQNIYQRINLDMQRKFKKNNQKKHTSLFHLKYFCYLRVTNQRCQKDKKQLDKKTVILKYVPYF